MADPKQRVELQQAFAWTCPTCNKRNLTEMIEARFESPEDLRKVHIAMGTIEEWQDLPEDAADYIGMVPDQVVCVQCFREFETGVENEVNIEDGEDED